MSFLTKHLKIIYSYFIRRYLGSCHKSVIFERVGLLVGGKYITIGANSSFQRDLYLTAWDSYGHQQFSPEITIGSGCAVGAYNHITCVNRIIIGDGLLTGKWVTITDNSHGFTDSDSLHKPPISRDIYSKGPVIIGKNVWIGDKATILAGVQIGDGVVVGANSVVTRNIPEYTVVAGNPAKEVKKLRKC